MHWTEVLVNGRIKSRTNSKRLLEALLDSGVSYCCGLCGIISWCGHSITLEIHHRSGQETDNRKENLILLCPNCHSITPNYRSKNRGKLNDMDIDEIYLG